MLFIVQVDAEMKSKATPRKIIRQFVVAAESAMEAIDSVTILSAFELSVGEAPLFSPMRGERLSAMPLELEMFRCGEREIRIVEV